ncbi:MAG: hypothetical protein AAF231_02650 [Pseudomonadota bacterium]
MRLPLGDLDDAREDAVARYLHLTKEVMPAMARSPACTWPVVNDHCFQRIVLDAVSGGVWYDHIARPAYRNMTSDQVQKAVTLCEGIISGTEDIDVLNRQSLMFRGKLKAC